jgi:hypothetical protein
MTVRKDTLQLIDMLYYAYSFNGKCSCHDAYPNVKISRHRLMAGDVLMLVPN